VPKAGILAFWVEQFGPIASGNGGTEMKQVLKCLHQRHEFVAQKYGKPVAIVGHVGEGAYFSAFAFGLSHEYVGPLYMGLFVVWVIHTVVVGFTGE
jgi:hypothetical protein